MRGFYSLDQPAGREYLDLLASGAHGLVNLAPMTPVTYAYWPFFFIPATLAEGLGAG